MKNLFLLFFISNQIIAQNLNDEFKELAEYLIIKQALSFWDDSKTEWTFYPVNYSAALNDIDFKYEIKEIYQLRFRFIEIEDQTNIGPYPNFKHSIAIKNFIGSDKSGYSYKEIEYEDLEYFINNFIYKEYKDVDNLKCIELYNLLKNRHDESIFLNDKTIEEFSILKSELRLQDYNKLIKSYDDYYYETVYKYRKGDTVSYYYLNYNFTCSDFKVDEVLLYRLKE